MSIKLNFEDHIRKIPYPTDFSQLLENISKFTNAEKVKLSYLDSDGDKITLTTQLEFQSFANEGITKINVERFIDKKPPVWYSKPYLSNELLLSKVPDIISNLEQFKSNKDRFASGKKSLAELVSFYPPNESTVSAGENFIGVFKIINRSINRLLTREKKCKLVAIGDYCDLPFNNNCGTKIEKFPVTGEYGYLAVSLTAPSKPGFYMSHFKLQAGETRFGGRFRIKIQVV